MADNTPTPELPDVAMSSTSTEENLTGSWKYHRPQYDDRVAPCNARCPVGIDVEGYLQLLRERRFEDALDLLLLENPIPAITGRVCDHPCELACNRTSFDDAVAVHAVERFLGDIALAGRAPKRVRPKRRERAAVIGSGPAGLACGYHLLQLGYQVTVYESAPKAGGMLRVGIPEYRLPRSVLDRQIEWLEAVGLEIRCNVRVGTDIPWQDLEEFDAIFIASGAHTDRPMGIDGEEAAGVQSGLRFLQRVNAGERPDLGTNVVVIGGGNTAMDCARTARRLGAKTTVLYRRSRAEMPAIDEEVTEAEAEDVAIVLLAAPVRVIRNGDGRLTHLECQRMTLGDADESGRRRPVPVADSAFRVEVDTVLTAIGEVPDLAFLPDIIPTEHGTVSVDESGASPHSTVFAGGDATDTPRTVAHALGSGKRAAIGIDRYLRVASGEPLVPPDLAPMRFADGNVSAARWRKQDPVPRTNPLNEVVTPEHVNFSHFRHVGRNPDEHESWDPRGGFREVNHGLRAQSVLDEARRCLACGVCNECELCLIYCPDVAIVRRTDGRGFYVSMDYCKGCGICVTECPRGAMSMTREGL